MCKASIPSRRSEWDATLAAEAGDTREIGIDLGAIEFAVAIAVSLAHKRKRGSIALSEGDGFRKSDNAVSVGVTSAEGDALGLIAADPLLFGDTPIGVRVGSGEDDEDQILSCLFAREFPVVIGVSKGEVDTYANPAKAQANLYTVSGLTDGSHTVTIGPTGRKNASSAGLWVWVDAFEFAP